MDSDTTTPAARRRYLVGWGISTLGSGLVFPLTAVYLRDHLDLSVFGVSLYFGLFAVSGLVVNPVAGALCDRGRPGWIALLATVFQGVGPAVLVLPGAHVAAALVSGAGTGIFYAVLTPLLISLFGKDGLSPMLAAQYRVSAGTVGAGALVGGVLVGSLGVSGYRACFLVNGLSFLLFGLVLHGVVRRGRTPVRPRRTTPESPADTPATDAGPAWARAMAPFTDRVFLWVLLMQGMVVTFGLGQVESVTPIVLHDSADLTVTGIGVVLTVNSLAVVVLQGRVLRAVKRLGHLRSVQVAVAFWALSLVVLWLSTAVTPWQGRLALAACYAAVFAVGECLVSPSIQPIVVDNAPPGKVASYSASTSFIHGISNLTAPSVCLPVFSALGFAGYLGLQLLGYAAAALAAVVLAAHGRRPRPPARETASRMSR